MLQLDFFCLVKCGHWMQTQASTGSHPPSFFQTGMISLSDWHGFFYFHPTRHLHGQISKTYIEAVMYIIYGKNDTSQTALAALSYVQSLLCRTTWRTAYCTLKITALPYLRILQHQHLATLEHLNCWELVSTLGFYWSFKMIWLIRY